MIHSSTRGHRILISLQIKGAVGFSLIEVCVAAVVLAIIGAQMYQLSSLTNENFRDAKNYLEADQKLFSEIAFARNAALRYTWCNVLYGIDLDSLVIAKQSSIAPILKKQIFALMHFITKLLLAFTSRLIF